METEALTLPGQDVRKLLAAANGDAALLYLYEQSGLPRAEAMERLRMTQTRYDLAAATLQQMGLWQEETKRFFAPAEAPHYTEEEVMDNGKTPLLMVLEDLQDPGNVGTIIRTAEGAGVTGIIMSRGTADIFNPKTIRSTMGSVYRMPFVYVEDLGKGIQDLKDKGITTYAAHLEGKHSYDEENLTNPCAFLIGNEGNGLRREIADMADCYIKIPMLGQVESLNAAIASSVLMFEAARQRRKAD